MTESAEQNRTNPLWNIFRSIKLTLVLLIILAVTSVIGTVIPQQEGAMELAERISPSLVKFLNTLQIFDMYHSIWFRFLIAALVLNLLVCSMDRLPASLKRLRAVPKPDRSKPFEDLSPDRSFSVKGEMTETVGLVAGTLKGRYSKIQTKETDKGYFLYGEKGRYSLFGFYLVHLSILLILVGGIIGSFFGFEAFVNIPEGETVETVTLRKSNAHRRLPFAIQCEKFTVDFYQNGAPKRYQSDITFIANGQAAQKGVLLVNHPLTFMGITFYQSTYGSIPGNRVLLTVRKEGDTDNAPLPLDMGRPYELPDKTGQFIVADARSDFMRLGPAVHVVVKPNEGDEIQFWVFQKREEIQKRVPGIFEKFPKLNPSAYKPYTFFLDQIETRYYTGLQVSRDPGVPLVWSGFFLIIFGLFVAFFMSHRSVWIHVSKTKKGVAVKVAGRSNKNPVGLEKELAQLTHRLRERLGADPLP